MQGRTALIAALVSGALAVAIVAVDLQFGLEAELQVLEDGEWVAVATSGEPYPDRFPGSGCVGRDLRVVVDNNRFLPTEVHVRIGYYNMQGTYVAVANEDWDIPAGEHQVREFSIPDSAFVPRESPDPAPAKPIGGYTVSVEGIVANQYYLSACVAEESQ